MIFLAHILMESILQMLYSLLFVLLLFTIFWCLCFHCFLLWYTFIPQFLYPFLLADHALGNFSTLVRLYYARQIDKFLLHCFILSLGSRYCISVCASWWSSTQPWASCPGCIPINIWLRLRTSLSLRRGKIDRIETSLIFLQVRGSSLLIFSHALICSLLPRMQNKLISYTNICMFGIIEHMFADCVVIGDKFGAFCDDVVEGVRGDKLGLGVMGDGHRVR